MKDKVLFGKYRLLQKLGSGRSGTVWLAIHLGLEEYRAIKCVPKTCADYETFRREALILKELQHPGIPLVYDLEEDTEYSYLVEEYLQGFSLYTLIKNQGALKEPDAVRYGMQICGLVEYIHSVCKIPILYLDLQPNNLIICDGTVKLIDFDHAAGSVEANQSRERYGTVGCAAPEQYTSDRVLDQRTDIYAIGAVLRFMVSNTLRQAEDDPAAISEPLGRIIRKCMEPDMGRRYASAKEAGDALRGLGVRELNVKHDYEARPSLIIDLTGMRHGAGMTHLGFGLLYYLTKQGYEILYEEHNRSQAVRSLALHGRARPDRNGIYHVNGCCMKPWYGPAVRLEEPSGFDIILKDYGPDWEFMLEEPARYEDTLVVMAAASPWDRSYADRMAQAVKEAWSRDRFSKTVVVLRHILPGQPGSRAGIPGWERIFRRAPVFASPEYEDPFRQQKETDTFFESIWDAVSGGFPRKGKRGWFKGWGTVKDVFLNAVRARHRDAGLQESQGQDAGQG